jgi:hypothetical protein
VSLVRFDIANDAQDHVVVEVSDDDVGLTRVARTSDGLVAAGKTLEAALSTLRPVAAAVIEQLRGVSPDEAQVEMGFKLSAQAGAILTKVGGEAHLVVTLVWKNKLP